MRYLRYLWAVFRHKWFVALECFKVGLIWRGLIHDWTKFLPDEFIPYANSFYGGEGAREAWLSRFNVAWLKHQHRHDHHWQSWLRTDDDPKGLWILGSPSPVHPDVFYRITEEKGQQDIHLAEWTQGKAYQAELDMAASLLREPVPMPMSHKARLEMLCDWKGAGRAYGNNDTRGWYLKRRHLMEARLHPETRAWVEDQLGIQ